MSAAAHDIAEFLHAHELFGGLDPRHREAISGRAEVETFPAGAVILAQGERADSVRLVRRGAVELLDGQGRALDRLGEGELFGHRAMLAGLPAGFEARAAEDTVCVRLSAADAVALLARPMPLAATADAARLRIQQLSHEPAVLCDPDVAVSDAARRMVDEGASCVLVGSGGAPLGIVTERDMSARVLGAGRPADTRVAEVMTSPVVTIAPETRAADAILTMLDRGIRHLPLITARGEIVGVLRDVDLLAAEARTPFVLRRAISSAQDLDGLKRAAARLNGIVLALYDARMNAAQISGVISVVTDALTRRLLELADAPPSLVWLALGSYGRREAMPSSDLDSAVAWEGAEPRREIVAEVLAGLTECGVRSDPNGAAASNRLFARSFEAWAARIEALLADPGAEQAMILLSLLLDGRPVTGADSLGDPFDALRGARGRPRLRRLLLRVGLAPRPPTGFLRDLVVEQSGEHRGHLDIKRGGLLPLVNLARYGGVVAGSRATGTVERLTVAGDAGTLPRDVAGSLLEAFDVLTGLRLDHQVEALRAGRAPDDFIDPRTLSPLARRYLREAFRAIASIQRTLGNALDFGPA